MKAFAKINLALVVGPLREDGKHEVVTVLQHVDLHDDVELEPADVLSVRGFPEDTLVRAALHALGAASGVEPGWSVRIEKRIPVAAGLGGGSSDAAAALSLANALLPRPLEPDELHRVAAAVGADVPGFLRAGPHLGTGDGSDLVDLDLPQDYVVLLALRAGDAKSATADVYRRFDERRAESGFDDRRAALISALARVERAGDLAGLPSNDLASSSLSHELVRLGAFRADVSGAGPVVYGLFEREEDAGRAAAALRGHVRTWLVHPVSRA